MPAFPDIPPLDEAGVPGFDAAAWQMVVAPARRRGPVVDKLNAELTAILAMPEVKEQIAQVRHFCRCRTEAVEELQEFVKSEIVRWGKVVQRRRHRGIAIDSLRPGRLGLGRWECRSDVRRSVIRHRGES